MTGQIPSAFRRLCGQDQCGLTYNNIPVPSLPSSSSSKNCNQLPGANLDTTPPRTRRRAFPATLDLSPAPDTRALSLEEQVP